MRVTVIDYKAGNLTSVLKALRYLGAEPQVTDGDLSLVESAERIVLPGVGISLRHTSRRNGPHARNSHLYRARRAVSRNLRRYAMALCRLDRAPDQPGLAHFAEQCNRFPEGSEKVPHVGWNSLEARDDSRLLAGIQAGEFVYFTHSYKAPSTNDTAATTSYIEPFAAAVERNNVFRRPVPSRKIGAKPV